VLFGSGRRLFEVLPSRAENPCHLAGCSVDRWLLGSAPPANIRSHIRGGALPRTLLVVGSAASLAANAAVAQPAAAGRVIAAWPSFALIGAYDHQVGRLGTVSAAMALTSWAWSFSFWSAYRSANRLISAVKLRPFPM
jgi:hypothetical protein